ncbi:hypothetical protein Tco_1509687 [Tanacetum coccineum]
MANISNYGSDVISKVPYSETYLDDMENQSVHAMQDFEQTLVVDVTETFYSTTRIAAEQAFWFRISNPTIESSNKPPVKVEVPCELPKVSLVNVILKKLKFHLAQFESVMKKRTTPDARTEGECGFELTKVVFNNEIIPFLKSLKDIFNVFDKYLLNEIMEVQIVFDQMEAAVHQSSVDKQCLEIAKKELLLENDRLIQQIMSQDVLLTVMNSMSLNENERLCKEINHVKQVFKDQFDSIKKTCVRTKEQSDSLIDKLNLKSAENEDLKAQIQDKVFVIISLKNDLRKLKGKKIVDIVAQIPSAYTIVPGMFKLDLEPLAPRLMHNREAHIDYLKYTQEQDDILRGIVEQAKAKQPLDKELDFSRLKCSTSNYGSKRTSNKKNNKISQTPSRNMKNKVEVVQIVLWYMDSECSKHMTGNRSQLKNFVSKFLGTVRFGNDHIARIIRFLRSKDEAPDAIIKCIKNIQVYLNATVCNVRTDNGTEFGDTS